jgi:hypothetical protein
VKRKAPTLIFLFAAIAGAASPEAATAPPIMTKALRRFKSVIISSVFVHFYRYCRYCRYYRGSVSAPAESKVSASASEWIVVTSITCNATPLAVDQIIVHDTRYSSPLRRCCYRLPVDLHP